LLCGLKAEGIATALDTCGLCSRQVIDRLIPFTDLVLYDLKLYDPELHHQLTGQTNQVILDNLRYIQELIRTQAMPVKLWIRTPLIPGATASDQNIASLGRFIAENLDETVSRWELCAFNNLCRDQYLRLNLDWAYAQTPLMTRAELAHWEEIARNSGVRNEIVLATGATRPADLL